MFSFRKKNKPDKNKPPLDARSESQTSLSTQSGPPHLRSSLGLAAVDRNQNSQLSGNNSNQQANFSRISVNTFHNAAALYTSVSKMLPSVPSHKENKPKQKFSLKKSLAEGYQLLGIVPDYLGGKIYLPLVESQNDGFYNSLSIPLLASVTLKRYETEYSHDFGIAIRKQRILSRVLTENGQCQESIKTIILLESLNGRPSADHGSCIYPGDIIFDVLDDDADSLSKKSIINNSLDEIWQRVLEYSKNAQELYLLVYPLQDVYSLHQYAYKFLPNLHNSDNRRLINSIHDQEPFTPIEKLMDKSKRAWLAYRDGYTMVNLLSTPVMKYTDHHNSSTQDIHTNSTTDACEVEIIKTGNRVIVDPAFVDMLNDPTYDLCANVSSLPYLNETSVIHVLRQRYGSNMWHTYADKFLNSLLTLHPLLPPSVLTTHTQALYGDRMMQFYHDVPVNLYFSLESDAIPPPPPHIFAIAQKSLYNLQNYAKEKFSSRGRTLDGGSSTTSTSLSPHPIVCLIGFSGAGKSFHAKNIVKYWTKALLLSPSSPQKEITVDQIQNMFQLIDAFTCARTLINTHASRCVRVISLDVGYQPSSPANHQLYLKGIQLQLALLERTRIVRRPEGEPTFHIFYFMLAGLNAEEKNGLFLDNLKEQNLFLSPLQREEEHKLAEKSWQQLAQAITSLNITNNEWSSVCQLLAVIIHLGYAGASTSEAGPIGADFCNISSAQRAATLLGCTVDYLKFRVFCQPIKDSNGQVHWSPIINRDKHNSPNPANLLESFVTGLYTQVVQIVSHFINRCFNVNPHGHGTSPTYSLSVLDPPGFQNAASLGRTSGATYEDFCYNLLHENLVNFYHNVYYHSPKKIFEQEEIKGDWMNHVHFQSSESVIRLMGGGGGGANDCDNDSVKYPTLLDLFDTAIAGAFNETSFIKQLDHFYKIHKSQFRNRNERLMTRVNSQGQFSIKHCGNSISLLYNPNQWLKNCREYQTSKNAEHLLSECGNERLRELSEASHLSQNAILRRSATRTATMTMSTSANNVVVSPGFGNKIRNGQSKMEDRLRHQSSSSAAAVSKAPLSLSMQVKYQINWLLDLLRRGGTGGHRSVYFVHCLLPVMNAGLSALRESDSHMAPSNEHCSPSVPLLRQQLRGIQLLSLLKIQRLIKLDTMGICFRDFRLLFEPLDKIGKDSATTNAMSVCRMTSEDEIQVITTLLKSLDVQPNEYEIGCTQVFLAPGVRERLEQVRVSGIESTIVALQCQCRMYLARKKAETLWMRQQAIQCIQRNAKIYLNLRQWKWWRLYQNVRPLIHVHRSEAELSSALEEMESIRNQLNKLENEKRQLQSVCENLKAENVDLKEELRESEHSTLYATNKLNSVQEKHDELQGEMDEMQSKFRQLEREKNELAEELLSLQSSRQGIVNNGRIEHEDSSQSDEGQDLTVLMERYHKAIQKNEILQREIQKMVENHSLDLEEIKKNQDRKNNELQEENERLSEELGASRRRQNKIHQDLLDLQNRLEQEQNHNADVERRHKKFDSELARVQSTAAEETLLRERLQRERDEALAEKFRSERINQDLRSDLELAQEKIKRLTQQLNVTADPNGKSTAENEIIDLRRVKVELEQRIRELEEEVDEQMSIAESMKQGRLRAEVNLERLRQQNAKLVEERDQEVEEVRTSMQRRIRQVEQQLEESRDERQDLIKERREIEQKLSELMNRDSQRDIEKEKKLRKDLKKHRALLKEAYLTIEELRKNQPDDKALLKQLRDQLEESESQRDTASRHKRQLTADLEECKAQLEDLTKIKQEIEERSSSVRRERDELQRQMEEQEEEMNNVLRKYRAAVAQQASDNGTLSAQGREIQELQEQREQLRRQLVDAEETLRSYEALQVNRSEATRWETKCRELEGRLDVEISAKNRLQHQNDRLREQVDQLEDEKDHLSTSEAAEKDSVRRLQRQVREFKEELEELESRAVDAERKRNEAIAQAEQATENLSSLQNEYKKAQRRVLELQTIIDDSLNRDSDSDNLDSDAVGSSGDRTSKFLQQVDKILKSRRSSLVPASPLTSARRRNSEVFMKNADSTLSLSSNSTPRQHRSLLSQQRKLLETNKNYENEEKKVKNNLFISSSSSSSPSSSSPSTLSLNELDDAQ